MIPCGYCSRCGYGGTPGVGSDACLTPTTEGSAMNTAPARSRIDFVAGFITATMWANSYGDTATGEAPCEADSDRLTAEDRATLTASAESFYAEHLEPLTLYVDTIEESAHATTGDGGAWGAAGHDLALTGAGHGTGFWDRGAGAVGETLSEAAKLHGYFSIGVADDGALSVTEG